MEGEAGQPQAGLEEAGQAGSDLPEQVHLVLEGQRVGEGQRLDGQLGPHGKGQRFFPDLWLLQTLCQGEEPDGAQAGAGLPQRPGRVLCTLPTQEQVVTLISEVKASQNSQFSFRSDKNDMQSLLLQYFYLHVYLKIEEKSL